MKLIKVSAPGKLHLLGEHSVVYGKPALLSSIDKRISIKISYARKKQILCENIYENEIKKLLEIIEEEIRKNTEIKIIEPYSITFDSQIPIGSGLGSSASLSAGITAAILSLLKIHWDKKMIFDIGYAGEKYIHGNPSGGDLAAVIQGGTLWFRKEFEFLKVFTALPFGIHKSVGQFALIDSGKPVESTKEMVEKVSRFRESNPKKTKDIFDSQEELTKKMVIALKDGDNKSFIDCIRQGEMNLERLGVVGKNAKLIIRKIEGMGGAAKINGGGGVIGGSGMLLAYHKDIRKVLNYTKHNGLNVLKIEIGEEGLRIDE